MIRDRHELLLPESATLAIDSRIYDEYTESLLGSREIYKDLSVKNQQDVKDAWKRGEDADLSIDDANEDELNLRKETLRAWRDNLLIRDDIDEEVKELYHWKVNEDIANVDILIASQHGDMDAFRYWNEYIYGKPDEDVYRGALDWIAHDADMLLAVVDQDPVIIEAATRVRDLCLNIRGYRELLAPEADTFEKVRDDHTRDTGYYGLLLAGVIVPEGKITNEVGDPILRHVLRENLNSPYTLADAKSASWGVAHSQGVVERPAAYNMPAKRFIGLGIGHEIGSHELERVNGLRGPLRLAAQGLDRYEKGNEGRAVIREQVLYETFDEFGQLVRWRDILRRHIAISYAYGVGDEPGHSSSEVHAFMNIIDTMYQAKLTPYNDEMIKNKARAKTDALLLRALKGTNGRGGSYLKDKVYLEGHVASWLTAAMKGPGAISDGDLGKFDINNPRHIKSLIKVGMLPDHDKAY